MGIAGFPDTVRVCGYALPAATTAPVRGLDAAVGGELGVTFPTALWQASTKVTSATPTIGGTSIGSSFSEGPFVILDGLSSTSAYATASFAWANAKGGFASTDLADDDDDTHPGITAPLESTPPYVLPQVAAAPLDGGPAPTAQAIYAALRTEITLTGTSTSCTAWSGTAAVPLLNFGVAGCQLTDGTDCDALEVSTLATLAPAYTVLSPGTYQSVILSTTTSACADVVAALP